MVYAGLPPIAGSHHRREARLACRLLLGSALAGAAAGILMAPSAHAQDACGAPVDGVVTCTPAGNPYPNGIQYVTPAADPGAPVVDLTVVLQQGVRVEPTGGQDGVVVTGVDGGAITLDGGVDTGITVNADDAFGVIGNTDTGDLTINTDSIVASGSGSGGIAATSDGGAIAIDANAIAVTGYDSIGIAADTYDGNVTIDVGSVAVAGDYASGIAATSAGLGTITVNAGEVRTSGADSGGIQAMTYLADIDITADVVSTTGGSGYYDGSVGIYAYSESGDISITSTTRVATQGDYSFGIAALSEEGNIAIAANEIVTAGDDAAGIRAIGFGADVTVDVGSITTQGRGAYGIAAVALGDVKVTSTGAITTTGERAPGVYVIAPLGSATVTVNDVTTTGDDSVGVRVFGRDATVTVNGDISTSGPGSYYGPDAFGLQVVGLNTANVTINGSVTTGGDNATGVRVGGGDTTVTNAGAIATNGVSAAGVYADSYYDSTVINSGTIATGGNFSSGVAVSTYNGAATVVNSGTISTTGDYSSGITIEALSDVTVQSTGSVATAGSYSHGITVQSFRDGSTLAIGAGNVRATGAQSNALRVVTFGSDVAVNLTGAVSSAQDSAVVITSEGDATVTVGAGGSVTGAANGIETDTPGMTTIDNAGTINTRSGYAIRVLDGPATIANAGTINGRVWLSDGDDSVANSGLFRVTSTSDFGAGADVFTNTGTVLVDPTGAAPVAAAGMRTLAVAAAAPLGVEFFGLEAFANSGLVDLRNGTVGDQFTLPGSFTGSGNSALGLDVGLDASGTMRADLLRVGTAAGSTQIRLAGVGPVFVTPSLRLVEVSTASSPTAFTLAPESSEIGFVAFDLAYNPATLSFEVVGTPGSAVYRTAKALEGAQSLWHRSADVVATHLAGVRDGRWATGGGASGMWMQTWGGVSTRDETRTATAFGVTRTFDLGYKQDYFGTQIGFDFGGMGEEGGAVFGLTGGYMSSVQRFDNGIRFHYDAADFGAYAGVRAGGFFADALAKYDRYWVKAAGGMLGYPKRIDGDSIGAQAEAGFRFGSARFFVEPVAGIAYVRTNLDDLRALDQIIDYHRMNGLRGKAGLRVGGSSPIGGGATLTFYGGAMAVKEFEGEGRVTFVSGDQRFDFGNHPIGTYGQATLGVGIATAGGITGFIEGTADVSGDFSGAGGRAGIKVRF